uniref:Uncharacterized protein n=1 Tax=viral metagenome TaxID=1070528 RepID=A0A6C0EJP3_9ZZZZ
MSTSKSERKNQVTPINDFDVKRMIFSEPQPGSIKDTTITFKRVYISVLNPDGSIGDLILETQKLFSFGVSENKDVKTQEVNGHVLPICLHNRKGPSEEEIAWVEKFNEIVEQCKEYLLQNKEEVGLYDLERAELKKFNPLYYKRESNGKIAEGAGPVLYAKLIASKKTNTIKSMFFDKEGESIEPLSLLKQYCFVNAAIKIESIFIGQKPSLQVKLYEAIVETMDTTMQPLLSRPKASKRVMTGSAKNMNEMTTRKPKPKPKPKAKPKGDSDADSDGEVIDSESDEEIGDGGDPQPKPKPKPKPKPARNIRRVKKSG